MDIVLKNVKKKDFPVLKSLAKSLGFEITIEEKDTSKNKPAKQRPYNEEFVKEILQGQKDIQEGKGIKMTMEKIQALCK